MLNKTLKIVTVISLILGFLSLLPSYLVGVLLVGDADFGLMFTLIMTLGLMVTLPLPVYLTVKRETRLRVWAANASSARLLSLTIREEEPTAFSASTKAKFLWFQRAVTFGNISISQRQISTVFALTSRTSISLSKRWETKNSASSPPILRSETHFQKRAGR